MIPSTFNHARNLTSVLVYIAHFQVISYVFHGRAFHPRLTRTHRRVMRCVHPACLGRGLVPSYPSQSTITKACCDGHGGSSTPSDSACSNTGEKRPLARCESGNAPKISGISDGFSSVISSSLLRGASFQGTDELTLLLEMWRALQHYSWGLRVNAHQVGPGDQRNTIWDVKLRGVLKKELSARRRSGTGCGMHKTRALLVNRAGG